MTRTHLELNVAFGNWRQQKICLCKKYISAKGPLLSLACCPVWTCRSCECKCWCIWTESVCVFRHRDQPVFCSVCSKTVCDNSEQCCCVARHSPFLIAMPLRIGSLVSGQTRLVAEPHSQGQASMVLAQLSPVQPVQSTMALFLEVVPPASRSHKMSLTTSTNLLFGATSYCALSFYVCCFMLWPCVVPGTGCTVT